MKKRKQKNDLSKITPSAKEWAELHPNAAGIDIGSTSHFVAVPEGRDEKHVREFESFTDDLHALADWLTACRITSVAMESTGVYWIPLYELLESRGFEVRLVNAHHVANVPGRKSDVLDCQWLQRLHTYGLLEGSFRPDQAVCVLRSYMRQRDMLIQCATSHIQHMQKALTQMNVQLHHVLSDITGMTGMAIIEAILKGERSPQKLAEYRNYRCKNNLTVIQKALEGNYREEHVFALRQAFELYAVYQTKIADCDQEMEALLQQWQPKEATQSAPAPAGKKKKRQSNEFHFDAHSHLLAITGVDLTSIDGIQTVSALKVLSEIGLDMERWKTAKHFASWLGLSPGSKISGGKRLSSKTKPCANRAASTLRIAASTLHHSHSALGAFFRRLKAHLGAPKAITATAHKLARLVYNLLKHGKDYVDVGQDYYEQQYRGRALKNLARKAKAFGLLLVEIPSEENQLLTQPVT